METPVQHIDTRAVFFLLISTMKGVSFKQFSFLLCFRLRERFIREEPNNPRLCEAGLIFVETITKLLSRLLDYRSVIQSEDNINNRMSCTVNILVSAR